MDLNTQGDEEGLTIVADDNLLPLLQSDVQGATLRLGLRDGTSLNRFSELTYQLTVKDLEALTVDGMAVVEGADLLRHALAQAAPQAIPALHLRASQWLEANDFIPEATRHAFQTKDWAYAAALVERHAWKMILHSQVSIVSDWCQAFPEAVISTSPALCVFHAWALLLAFKREYLPAATIRIEQAQATLNAIEPHAQIRVLPDTPPMNLLAWVTGHLTLVRSFILAAAPRLQADPQAMQELGELAYQQFPPEDATGRSVGLLDISHASQALSNAAEAEPRLETTMQVALSGGNYFGAVVAEYHRAHGRFIQGRLRETLAFCQQKKQTYSPGSTVPSSPPSSTPPASPASVGHAPSSSRPPA